MQELITYTQDAPALPAERLPGWTLIGRGKLKMEMELNRKELGLQALLTGYETMEIAPLQTAIAAYKKDYTLLVEKRKEFTVILDNIKDGCMVVEKRMDTKAYEPFIKSVARELTLRTQAFDKAKADTALATEKANFKAHFENEYMNMTAEFRQEIANTIHQAYTSCLAAKTPVADVTLAIELATKVIAETKPRDPKIFPRVLLDVPTAQAIYNSIPYPEFPRYRLEGIAALNEKFSMYANDLEAAEIIIQETNVQHEAQKVEATQFVQTAAAANLLMASAMGSVMPSGVQGVKVKTKIKIEDDNQKWVVVIISAFLSNFQKAFMQVRVKKYSALTVAQMAAALDAADVKVDGILYEEIKS